MNANRDGRSMRVMVPPRRTSFLVDVNREPELVVHVADAIPRVRAERLAVDRGAC